MKYHLNYSSSIFCLVFNVEWNRKQFCDQWIKTDIYVIVITILNPIHFRLIIMVIVYLLMRKDILVAESSTWNRRFQVQAPLVVIFSLSGMKICNSIFKCAPNLFCFSLPRSINWYLTPPPMQWKSEALEQGCAITAPLYLCDKTWT